MHTTSRKKTYAHICFAIMGNKDLEDSGSYTGSVTCHGTFKRRLTQKNIKSDFSAPLQIKVVALIFLTLPVSKRKDNQTAPKRVFIIRHSINAVTLARGVNSGQDQQQLKESLPLSQGRCLTECHRHPTFPARAANPRCSGVFTRLLLRP